MNFTPNDIRALAECERKMDKGEIPFVINHGLRMSVNQSAMDFFKLEKGQTITDIIAMEIIKFTISEIEAEIDERKLNAQTEGEN